MKTPSLRGLVRVTAGIILALAAGCGASGGTDAGDAQDPFDSAALVDVSRDVVTDRSAFDAGTEASSAESGARDVAVDTGMPDVSDVAVDTGMQDVPNVAVDASMDAPLDVSRMDACLPETDSAFCIRLRKNCGEVSAPDNCGVVRDVANCGVCDPTSFCGSATPNVCGPFAERSNPVCSPEGWCWVNPLPTGNYLYGAHASAGNNVWVVGAAGTAIHWDGASWSGWTGLIPGALQGVWAASSSDVWAVGDGGAVLHWDGARWTSIPSGATTNWTAVWGDSPSHVWVVGDNGILLWNGSTFTRSPVATPGTDTLLHSVHGTSANDAWIGANGKTLHWDGTTWSFTRQSQIVHSIWAASPSDVWAIGTSGVLHWTGTAWTTDATVTGSAVFGTSSSDVTVVSGATRIWHFDGTSWTLASTMPRYPGALNALAVTSSTDAVAVGDSGQILRWNGTTWRGVAPNGPGVPTQLWSDGEVFPASLDEAWVVGVRTPSGSPVTNFLIHAVGGVGFDESLPGTGLRGIWGSSSTDIWAVGDYSRIVHGNGFSWTEVSSGTTKDLSAIWGSSASDAWAVGQDQTVHYDGSSWSPVPNPLNGTAVFIRSIAGTSPTDVWAGGSRGNLMHYDGTSWVTVPSGVTFAVNAIWCAAPNDCWASSSSSPGIHWDGSTWTIVPGANADSLWGSASNDVWGVDPQTPGIRHWDGASWSTRASPAQARLTSIRGSDDSLWLVAEGARILRRPRPAPGSDGDAGTGDASIEAGDGAMADAAANGSWSPAADMGVARGEHIAALVPPGHVFVVAGLTSNLSTSTYITQAQEFDPFAGSWTTVAPMPVNRFAPSGVALQSGLVLVTGDEVSGGTESPEMFDSIANAWRSAGVAPFGVYRGHTLTLLADGTALQAGDGYTAFRFDPVAVTWRSAGNTAVAHRYHTATVLQSGEVLIAGGASGPDVEIFSPATNSWRRAANMSVPRQYHTATLLQDGRVLVVGGRDYSGMALATTEIYDPATDTWTSTAPLDSGTARHTATLLADGRVLVTGGSFSAPFGNVRLYDPRLRSWLVGPSMRTTRISHTATLLPSGQVVVAGGFDINLHGLSSVEIYSP